jgi:hypothetical protein
VTESLSYLRTPEAIRDKAERLLKYVEEGQSRWFTFDPQGLESAVQTTLAATLSRYPSPSLIPFHSRWRHFEAGGRDRWTALAPRLAHLSKEEIARRRMDLAIVSVLLDAGAGPDWKFREPSTNESYARSEGLGVASIHMFAEGTFSRDAKDDPLRVDAERLVALTPKDLALHFQVTPLNPIRGLEGRAALLQKLGAVGLDRPGRLFDIIATGSSVKAATIFTTLIDKLSSVWPRPMGDVWPHPAVGLVPFHKLTQWLSYSLVEPFEDAGIKVLQLDALTGLPEYRNGGLLIDSGALRTKQTALSTQKFMPEDEPIVEWRALTVAALDRIADRVRKSFGLDRERLPLVKVLEGGTWFAGRLLAAERRSDGGPPIAVVSDGTIF